MYEFVTSDFGLNGAKRATSFRMFAMVPEDGMKSIILSVSQKARRTLKV
jgi:hypothetical protein